MASTVVEDTVVIAYDEPRTRVRVACGPLPLDFEADSDSDGVADVMDVCPETPAGTLVDVNGRPVGDLDLDCDADLIDLQLLTLGFTGP